MEGEEMGGPSGAPGIAPIWTPGERTSSYATSDE
jgi:hypothetical protein